MSSQALFMTRKDKTFAYSEFAKLPLDSNGRVQPVDSLARNSLLQIRGITQVPLPQSRIPRMRQDLIHTAAQHHITAQEHPDDTTTHQYALPRSRNEHPTPARAHRGRRGVTAGVEQVPVA